MKEIWTGEVVGEMHIHEITQDDIAKELGCRKSYVSMILNGQRSPKDAERRVRDAIMSVIRKRGEQN